MRIRTAFEQYVTKSQQLTEIMRKEYHARTGKKWHASEYSGWNNFTDTLKAIRNATYHGVPLQLNVVTIGIYPPIEIYSDEEELPIEWVQRGFRAFKGTSFVGLPFSSQVAVPGVGYPKKYPISSNSNDRRNYIYPFKEFVSYELTNKLLENGVKIFSDKIQTTDVVSITLKSFPILHNYWVFYCNELENNCYSWTNKSLKQ